MERTKDLQVYQLYHLEENELDLMLGSWLPVPANPDISVLDRQYATGVYPSKERVNYLIRGHSLIHVHLATVEDCHLKRWPICCTWTPVGTFSKYLFLKTYTKINKRKLIRMNVDWIVLVNINYLHVIFFSKISHRICTC